jgi:hypothetical protein
MLEWLAVVGAFVGGERGFGQAHAMIVSLQYYDAMFKQANLFWWVLCSLN